MSGYHQASLNVGPYNVYLSSLNWANPACRYAYPTRVAAHTAALMSKTRNEDRVVLISEPDGTLSEMTMDADGIASVQPMEHVNQRVKRRKS